MAEVTFGCVGDVHGAYDRLREALGWLTGRDPDAILLVGDFTRGMPPGRAGADEAADPLGPLRRGVGLARETGLPVAFVPGNHDPPEAPLEENVDRSPTTIAGVRIYGIGGAGPARMGFPYEWGEETLARLSVPARDLLLTHAPPAETSLDRTASGRHVGSRVLRRLAAGTRGALVCGHIHESVGLERLGDCLCYNVGAVGGVFRRVQAGLLRLDLSDGRVAVAHWVREDRGWRLARKRTVTVGKG